MRKNHKEIRAYISKQLTPRAMVFLKCFDLKPEDAEVIILCDVKGMSTIAAAEQLHVARETVTRRKARGYDKIALAVGDTPLEEFDVDA